MRDYITRMSGRDPSNGHFLPGNQFWKARSSHGRNPKYADPETLRDAIEQYFEWNDANPLYEAKLVSFQGVSTLESVPKLRAMTIAALCMYIGINRDTWDEWKRSRPDFSEVMTWAEDAIYQQKFTGASADLLNANIIARDLGLADKRDLSSKDGSMSPNRQLTAEELAAEMERRGIPVPQVD
jgi:hypothetical protein